MPFSVTILIGTLLVLGYLVAPSTIILGWLRWFKAPESRTASSLLSLVSLALATGSALLWLITVSFAQAHHFGFYDPVLMRIDGIGALLSFISVVCSLLGIWRRNCLRWYAPASAVGTFALWVMAAAGE